ncbi:hypothetical protein [Cupriavidus metallidurans]|uniref:hypothetical protein n=1 Tax=Cupriavidus metallidurans TaxID=119219 RepID=UPI001644B9DF|nr:hypothetical protein [Cupriavidus metallidurans]
MEMSSYQPACAELPGVVWSDVGECLPLHAAIFSEFACAAAIRPAYRSALREHIRGQFDGGLFISYAERLGWVGLADIARCCKLTAHGRLLVSALERSLDGYWTGVPPESDAQDRLIVGAATAQLWESLQ